MNVPRVIGVLISSRLATLAELDTVLGAEDVQDMLEVLTVDAHNKRIAAKLG